jgi:hypothetical protein
MLRAHLILFAFAALITFATIGLQTMDRLIMSLMPLVRLLPSAPRVCVFPLMWGTKFYIFTYFYYLSFVTNRKHLHRS